MSRLGAWRHPLFALALVVVGLGLVVAGSFLLAVALTPTPDIASFASRQLAQSTKIYDRTGQVLLYDYNKDARRTHASLKDISPNAINATIAIEDSNFYQHGGIRITSIIRAALADIVEGSLSQGGSTITQQVVKNTLLTNRKSIIRKVHELVLATRLEEAYSKDQILETYMNTIPYGGILYGVAAASQAYFGTPPKDLSVAESAYLAAMIQAPTYYSPYGSHRSQLDARKNIVLERMKTLGFISTDEYEKAKGEAVTFAPHGAAGIIAPHFVFYILNQLEETYGANSVQAGLKVITTLDAALQAKEEEIIKEGALKNAANGGATNAALIALDPQTGQILAMVGSRDFFDTAIDGQYNATLALRQPGSTMKPFAYVAALMRGYTRNTVVFDVPTQFSTACSPTDVYNQKSPCFAPKNYSNTYHGPMTFETALAQSVNIPAVKVVYLAGVKNVIDLAHSFGLSTIADAKQCGLTVVLGGCEVRLLDLVGAYATFGAGGIHNPPTGILEVDGADGTVLAKYEPAPTRVVPESYANDINAMLSDIQARIPEYRPGGVLDIPGYEVAAKTGTTDNSRDAWTVGYTPSVAVGIWVGNNDNSAATSLAGLVAAPIWKKAMAAALPNYPQRYFGAPNPIPASVPPVLRGDFLSVGFHDILYSVNKSDPRGGLPGNPASDPQFAAWEYGVQAYAAAHPGLFYNPPLMVPLSYGEAVPDSSTTNSSIPSL